jgi:enoyl-[acyl-carrier protein] reductase I
MVMTVEIAPPLLNAVTALAVGVANQHSLAYGCANAFHELGVHLAIT